MISTAVDASAVARVVGIKTKFKDLRGGNIAFLPQRIAVVGQGASSVTFATTKRQVASAFEAASLYGFGSPIHLVCKQLFPINGDGVGSIPVTVYPLTDAASGVAATGDITPAGTATAAGEYRVRIGGVLSEAFIIPVGAITVTTVIGDMVAAINAVLDMPVIAADGTTKLNLTAKWKGVSGNDIKIEVIGPTAGVTFAITQLTGGLVNPDVQDALDQIGNVWETLILNCLNISDTTALDTYSAFGEGRWGALVKKPLVVFTGNTASTVANATAISDVRKTDRVNAQLVAPSSRELPFVVAAAQLAKIAVVANNSPASDYGSQEVTGITPGPDGEQWLFADRDSAIKKGSSTIEVKDGVLNISDVVTFYHPSGDPLPAYRYVCDIIKLQNVIFNIDLIFASKDWNGCPLVPDNQPTVNPDAKKPKTAKAAIAAIVDSLGLEAIISEPDFSKASIQTGINEQNPKRLDASVTVKLSGNSNIISIDLNFGYYFGSSQGV